ncbi:uncharacterized protein [Rutidosis leptorrhynchoides]|uniref:uncharacterized protein n=1 Tax=Rutidosis leptorrhynchoides TaxID=125765 RepID=UPI003A9A1207
MAKRGSMPPRYAITGVSLLPRVQDRGLRLGDPLSPFLFMTDAEGLIKGAEIRADSIMISQLQYVDATIFWSGTENMSETLIKQLKNFEYIISGLKVNSNQSCVYGIGGTNTELDEMAS